MNAITAMQAVQPLEASIQTNPLVSVPAESARQPSCGTNAQVVVAAPIVPVIGRNSPQENRLAVNSEIQMVSTTQLTPVQEGSAEALASGLEHPQLPVLVVLK
jgi:hypothetical protein